MEKYNEKVKRLTNFMFDDVFIFLTVFKEQITNKSHLYLSSFIFSIEMKYKEIK